MDFGNSARPAGSSPGLNYSKHWDTLCNEVLLNSSQPFAGYWSFLRDGTYQERPAPGRRLGPLSLFRFDRHHRSLMASGPAGGPQGVGYQLGPRKVGGCPADHATTADTEPVDEPLPGGRGAPLPVPVRDPGQVVSGSAVGPLDQRVAS
ncbi:hypothetical protein GCM10023080_074160 [Streptomyces pseudoechinosporeus]